MKYFYKTLLVIASFLLFASVAMASTVTMTVGSADNIAKNASVDIPITVDNSAGIAGAAFTFTYDTNVLKIIDINSTFFDTFEKQFIAINPSHPGPFSVNVDGNTYDEPIITNKIENTGTRIAAARAQPSDGSNLTLFTVTFQLIDQTQLGPHTVSVEPTVLENVAAGYDTPGGDMIDLLIGYVDPDQYPVKLGHADYSGFVNSGELTFKDETAPGAPASGDFDGNGVVEIWDILSLIDLMDGQPTTAEQQAAVDMDSNGEFDVFDIIMMIDKM